MGSMSLEAWVNVQSIQDVGIISSETPASGFAFAIVSGRLTFTSNPAGGSPTVLNSSTSFPTNGWHYVVAVFESVGGAAGAALSLYVDAIRVSSGPPSPPATGAGYFAIGARMDGNEDRFVGLIDEVAVYNVALSTQDIATHFAAASATTPPNDP